MGVALEAGSRSPAEEEPPIELNESALDDLSRDELETLLAEELSAVDDSLKGTGIGTE
jgi:hypothetical protein